MQWRQWDKGKLEWESVKKNQSGTQPSSERNPAQSGHRVWGNADSVSQSNLCCIKHNASFLFFFFKLGEDCKLVHKHSKGSHSLCLCPVLYRTPVLFSSAFTSYHIPVRIWILLERLGLFSHQVHYVYIPNSLSLSFESWCFTVTVFHYHEQPCRPLR